MTSGKNRHVLSNETALFVHRMYKVSSLFRILSRCWTLHFSYLSLHWRGKNIRARTHTHTKRYSEAIWKMQPFERVSVMSIFPQNGNSRHTQTRLFVKANLCFRLLDVARENKADWNDGDEERTDEHREKGNYRSESGGFVTKRQHWRVLCSLCPRKNSVQVLKNSNIEVTLNCR